jgi:hypothetical protein
MRVTRQLPTVGEIWRQLLNEQSYRISVTPPHQKDLERGLPSASLGSHAGDSSHQRRAPHAERLLTLAMQRLPPRQERAAAAPADIGAFIDILLDPHRPDTRSP